MKRLLVYAGMAFAIISCNSGSDTSATSTDSTTMTNDASNSAMDTDTSGTYNNGSSGSTTGAGGNLDTTSSMNSGANSGSRDSVR